MNDDSDEMMKILKALVEMLHYQFDEYKYIEVSGENVTYRDIKEPKTMDLYLLRN